MSVPNILLITTDQQRFDTINALGNNHIYTPHLNWLTDQGITFTRCYSDSPLCMPARATIMTGKHGYTLGIASNVENITPLKDHTTLPTILTQNGYQTRAQGKMHFNPIRANYGFEHMELPLEYYREMNRNQSTGIPKAHGVGENEIEPVISTVHETQSLTYWTAKRSIDFIETRDETRPFFLWTSFTKPHPPFDPCLNYWSLYNGKDVPEPSLGDWSQQIEDVPPGFMYPTYLLNSAYRLSKDQLKDVKRAYYACITQIDYSLGLLFARMREMDLLDNTFIIFTSDHGDNMGDHHMAAKSNFLEGCAHIPLIVMPPPSVAAQQGLLGKKCDTLVSLADIMPTILDIANAPIPQDLDGNNLLNIAKVPTENKIFYGQCDDYTCIIDGYYKYIITYLGGDELLFNLQDDPKEQKNLSKKPENIHMMEEFRKRLLDFCQRYYPEKIEDGKIIHGNAPTGPLSVGKWPGFHSTVFPSDVLH